MTIPSSFRKARKTRRSHKQIKPFRVNKDPNCSETKVARTIYSRSRPVNLQPTIEGSYSLKDQNFLSSDIIDEFVRLVGKMEEELAALPSLIWPLLTSTKPCIRLPLWRQRTPINGKTKYFFPICERKHWSLIYVDTTAEECYHYTSFGEASETACRLVLNFLESCAISKGYDNKFQHFKIVLRNRPQQSNGYDCGVYVAMYTYRLFRGLRPNEPIDESPVWRKRIFTCLREKSLRIFDVNIAQKSPVICSSPVRFPPLIRTGPPEPILSEENFMEFFHLRD